MIISSAIIQNEAGIHCRPTALIVKYASACTAKLLLLVDGEAMSACSFLALMSLGLMEGDRIDFSVDGENEENVAIEFKVLLETKFDFPNEEN